MLNTITHPLTPLLFLSVNTFITDYTTLFVVRSGSSWLKFTPWGLRKALNWARNNYGDVPIYITENGVSDRNGSLQDDHRIYYYKHYINNMLKGLYTLTDLVKNVSLLLLVVKKEPLGS